MATVTTEPLLSTRLRGVLLVVILHLVLIPPLDAISELGKWIQDVDNVSASPDAVSSRSEILTLVLCLQSHDRPLSLHTHQLTFTIIEFIKLKNVCIYILGVSNMM